MKVLLINKYFYPKGGSESVFFSTLNILKKNGIEVIPLAVNSNKNNRGGNQYFINFPELSQLKFLKKFKYIIRFFYNTEAKRKLKKLIIEEKPDIAHIHLMFNSFSISILPLLKKYNIPVVLTLHDYRLICPNSLLMDKNKHLCKKCIQKEYWKCAKYKCSKGNLIESLFLAIDMYLRTYLLPIQKYIDKFICVSNFEQNIYLKFRPDWKSKFIQIYNPIKHLEPTKSIKGNYLLFFGRLSQEKGIETLINAMSNLPQYKLKIVGTGDYLEKKDNYSNITFCGYKEGKELADLISQAAYTIVPSEWYETFGLIVIESFKLGTPVISSDIGGLSELIDNKKNGFLFEAGNVLNLTDTIQYAMTIDNTSYFKMANEARLKASEFNDNKYFSELISLYKSLILEKNKNS